MLITVALIVAAAILAPGSISAQPRPGRSSKTQHHGAEGLLRELEPVLRLSDEELVALVPERSGLYFVGCPNCDGGTQENQIAWSIERPDEVYCRFCEMRFPNEQYPDDQVRREPRGRDP